MANEIFIKAPNFVRLLFKEFDESSVSAQIEKLLFFFFSSFMMTGALVWGFLCLVYGYRMPSLIPFGYVLLTLFNFLFCGSSMEKTKVGCNIQIFASLVLPFVFQYTLGGIAASGMVMLWSLLALLGSLILQEKKLTYIWVGLFIGLTIGSFYLEAQLPEEQGFKVPVLVSGLNILMVSMMVYGLGHYFSSTQNKMRNVLREQKAELKESQALFDEELMTAKCFQEVLLKHQSLDDFGYKAFQIKTTKSKINGNFTWAGEYGNKRVTVIIDNPCCGIRGSLESMFLWNMIDSAVYKLRMKTPLELIDYIQSEVFSRYDSEEIRNGLKDIGVVVLYHDTITHQLFYAALDTTFIMGTRLESRVVCGFKSDYSETVLSSNGTKLVKGSVLLEPGMRVIVTNKALLKARGLQNDGQLISGTHGFSSMIEHEFFLAEKRIKLECDKLDVEEDIFLQCIEF